MHAGFSYEVLHIHDIGKRSALLENVAGCAKLDVYIYSPITKWRHWGMFIH